MPKFDKNKIKELKEFLYYSQVHDAKIENIELNFREKDVRIEILNSFFNIKICITFLNIELIYATKGTWNGNSETILSLSALDDCSSYPNGMIKDNTNMKESIYLFLQMFSGDEFHIVCKEIIIENCNQNIE